MDENKNKDLDDIAASYVDGVFLVAWHGDQVIGTGAFKPRPGGQIEIVRMSVRRDWRRRGVGRQILDALCCRAVRAGYRVAILETTATWQGVIDFYRAYGFAITHYTNGDVWFRMPLLPDQLNC